MATADLRVVREDRRLGRQALESYLWGAANLLRGLVDAGDYKQYAFPLLFFKRLSDVWDEERRAALDETGDEGYARATADDRFAIPDGAHWSDVRGAARDVGRVLRNAFRALETANPERLAGVFGAAPWTEEAAMRRALIERTSSTACSASGRTCSTTRRWRRASSSAAPASRRSAAARCCSSTRCAKWRASARRAVEREEAACRAPVRLVRRRVVASRRAVPAACGELNGQSRKCGRACRSVLGVDDGHRVAVRGGRQHAVRLRDIGERQDPVRIAVEAADR